MTISTVRRHDVIRFDARKAQKLDNGFLRAPAQISRIGIYEYLNEDGTVRRELRLPDDVFQEDSLRSFAMMPVTDGHPPPGWVTADNAREYQCGTMGEALSPAPDGVHVAGTMMITDAALVRKVLSGESPETSCGYTCSADETPGIVDKKMVDSYPGLQPWLGQRFDVRQTNIRGNHVAVLPRGRAGSEARVKLDKGDAIVITDSHRRDVNPQEALVKITIRGITFDVPDQAAEALVAERADAQQALDTTVLRVDELEGEVAAARSAVEKEKARADTAEAEAKKQTARADGAASPAAIAAAVKLRTDLADVAKRAGVEVDLEKFDAEAIKRSVVEKLTGLKLDGKSPEYVAAAFDIERTKLDERVVGAEVVEVVEGQDKNGSRADADKGSGDARLDMIAEQSQRWKKPIPGAVKA
jgi:hypothetical protein